MALKLSQNQFIGKTEDIPNGLPEGATFLNEDTGEFLYCKNGVLSEISHVSSLVALEPSGSDQVSNMVSLTQAEYNSGSKREDTFYIITDA